MLTAPICPDCRTLIAADDINVAKDVAYCRRCNAGQKLSELLGAAEPEEQIDLERPPAGAWCKPGPLGVVVGASHRSWGKALAYLGISLFWNGIVSVFVLVALSGTLHHLQWPAPDWFPAPKMNGHDMGLGELIFLWVFLTPFITVGAGMLLGLISALGGRTEIQVTGSASRVYVGVGPVGWSRRFDSTQVRKVELAQRAWRNSNADPATQTEIRLEEHGGRVIKFGSLLNEERQHFLTAALRKILL